jgi:LemA protein
MDYLKDIVQKHQVVVKEMGVLEQNIEISFTNLKDISFDLGMTEIVWEHILQLAQEKFVLAQKHFSLKSFDSCVNEAEQAQLLNPFLNGVRGLKSKALLLRALNENDDSFLISAEHQAKLTLEHEPSDKNALEVMSTLSSKKRILKKDGQQLLSKKNVIAILIGFFIVIFILIFVNLNSSSPAANEAKQQVETVEKQLESAFEKQEAIIPKVKTLLKDANNKEELLYQLNEIENKLKNQDITIEKRYPLNNELNKLLSSIIYDASFAQDSQLLKDIRVLLEGAENRIKIERKNYNEAVTNYNSNLNSNETPLKTL